MSRIDRRQVEGAAWLDAFNRSVSAGVVPTRAPADSFERLVVDLGLVSRSDASDLIRRARREGVSLLAHLRAEGLVPEDNLYRTLAAYHNLPYLPELGDEFAPAITPSEIHQCLAGRWVEVVSGNGEKIVVAAPARSTVTTMRHIGGSHGRTGPIDAITSPATLRRYVETHFAGRMSDDAVLSLAETRPDLSAERRLGDGQRVVIAATALAFGGLLLASPFAATTILFGGSALLFAAAALGRLIEFTSELGRPPVPVAAPRSTTGKLPLYTVLVPLFREPHAVEAIVGHLMKLDYPRSRLDIKLVLEADDRQTQADVDALELPGCFEVVRVPPTWPRTRAKALAYALKFARGSLLTVYDAGSAPAPDQLQRAAEIFAAGGRRLACLQAGCSAKTAEQSWLGRQSAIECAHVVQVQLPAAARIGLPLAVAGTTHHFRTEALRRTGGWDPYNQSSDVDMAIRLARHGYRCGRVESETAERAPAGLAPWLRQRTRRLQGALQTWLVHMRQPGRAVRNLGWRRFLALQLTLGGGLFAALAHPLLVLHVVLSVAMAALSSSLVPLTEQPLFIASAAALTAGYGVVIELGILGLYRARRPDLLKAVALMPAYWMANSLAAYGAVWRLIAAPHRGRTPRPARRRKPALKPLRSLWAGDHPVRNGRREAVQRAVDTGGREQRPHASHIA